jgi:hypothetical protein
VSDIQQVHNTCQERLEDVMRGRDTFREQYLEFREINKQLNMRLKALEKSHNAIKVQNTPSSHAVSPPKQKNQRMRLKENFESNLLFN